MGRTSEGSDDDPDRFASGFTLERDGMYGPPPSRCGSYLLRWYAVRSIRHERSHIMYWKCGRNRLMSFVKRKKIVLIPAVHPTVKASGYFCDVCSVGIAKSDWLQSQSVCALWRRQTLTCMARRRLVWIFLLLEGVGEGRSGLVGTGHRLMTASIVVALARPPLESRLMLH